MKNEELKPCPFCGSKAKLRKEGHREYAPTYSVECTKCLAKTFSIMVKQDAIEHWNGRADNGET